MNANDEIVKKKKIKWQMLFSYFVQFLTLLSESMRSLFIATSHLN
jgi:hypothetical protein